MELKRGRRPQRTVIKILILSTLERTGMGTVEHILREIKKNSNHSVSWNTVNKYLQELVSENKVKKWIPQEASRLWYKHGRPIYFTGSDITAATQKHAEHFKAVQNQ